MRVSTAVKFGFPGESKCHGYEYAIASHQQFEKRISRQNDGNQGFVTHFAIFQPINEVLVLVIFKDMCFKSLETWEKM